MTKPVSDIELTRIVLTSIFGVGRMRKSQTNKRITSNRDDA